MKMTDLIIGGLLLLGIGLFIGAIWQYTKTKTLLHTGTRTEATVIENVLVESESDHGTSMMYQPIMEYVVNGVQQKYVATVKSNPPSYAIGERVAIIYAEDNPQDVRIVSYWGLHLASIILLAFAMPMLTICGGYFLFKAGLI